MEHDDGSRLRACPRTFFEREQEADDTAQRGEKAEIQRAHNNDHESHRPRWRRHPHQDADAPDETDCQRAPRDDGEDHRQNPQEPIWMAHRVVSPWLARPRLSADERAGDSAACTSAYTSDIGPC